MRVCMELEHKQVKSLAAKQMFTLTHVGIQQVNI